MAIEGKLKSAVALDELTIQSIRKSFESLTGEDIKFTVEVTPELLGGFVVVIGNKVYDRSIRSHLSKLKNFIVDSEDVPYRSDAFEDGDFVFAQMEYDFASRKICFEVFKFDDSRAVEHWDNIQDRIGPNQSGRSMVDGPIEATDHELTESNRALVLLFIENVLVDKQFDQLNKFINEGTVRVVVKTRAEFLHGLGHDPSFPPSN